MSLASLQITSAQATSLGFSAGHAAALANSMRRAASTPLGPARSQRQLQVPARLAEAEDASAVQNAVNSGMGFILGDILVSTLSWDAVRLCLSAAACCEFQRQLLEGSC